MITCARKEHAADPAFAYGYLSSAVRAYLDGGRSTEYMRLIVAELDAAVYGSPDPDGGEQ